MNASDEGMVSEVNEVAPTILRLIRPGDRVLYLGPEDSDLRPAIAEISEEVISMGDSGKREGMDCVVIPFVLQFLAEEEEYSALIETIHECLKPGGWMVAIDREEFLDPSQAIVGLHPRGILRVLDEAPWKGSMVHPCDYENHWMGAFLKEPIDMPVDDAPVFHRKDDGIHAETDPMPETIAVGRELLDGNPSSENSPVLQRKGDLIDFDLANGRWVYKIIGWARHGEAIATLEYTE